MAVSDHDLETLEVWLDGELPVEQGEALRRRLSTEPDLAQAIDRLRADRQLRSQVWLTSEPGDADVDKLVETVRRGIRRDEIWTMRYRALRNVSSIAASIVLVFMVGWISRDRLKIGEPVQAQPAVAANTAPAVGGTAAPTLIVANPPQMRAPVAFPSVGDSRNMLVSAPMAIPHDSRGFSILKPRYSVTVRDPFGQTLYSRELEDLDDMRKLPDEIARSININAERGPGGSGTVPVSDQQR